MSSIQQSTHTLSDNTSPSLLELPALSTPLEVQQYTGIPITTLAYWRFEGSHLPFVKMGRSIRYRRSDVISFVNSNVFSSTAEAKAAK
ncbi:helix-turn-helix domain-containing protein [Bifidobacterium crudilactis]|jgi:hypothetical protein|uniref:helix-turn-helix domain-containing protein n=1 Tax=Bifidobacterium crudilactis TaxID=327277 RepID=UPI003C6C2B0F